MIMTERHEFEGEWWLPGREHEKRAGKLLCDPDDGVTLELIGVFRDLQESTADIILGISTVAKPITLRRCIERERTVALDGPGSSVFDVGIVLVNCRVQRVEDLKFKLIGFASDYLDSWMGKGRFKESKRETDGQTKYSVVYTTPRFVSAELNHFKISLGYGFTTEGDRVRAVTLRQTTYINVEHRKALDLEECLYIVGHVQNFLRLAVRRPVYPKEILGSLDNKDTTQYAAEVYYSVGKTPGSLEHLTPGDMLFTFGQISKKFETHMRSWFANLERLEPVFHLYFGLLHSPRMYENLQFLTLTQAIETYHRRLYDGTDLPEKKHTRRINRILNRTAAEYRTWLVRKLQYSNELTLRRRLRDIMSEYGLVFQTLRPSGEAFISKVVSTRNYLTHYSTESDTNALVRAEQRLLWVQKLKIIMEGLLLRQAGFDLDEIRDLGSRNYDWKFWLPRTILS